MKGDGSREGEGRGGFTTSRIDSPSFFTAPSSSSYVASVAMLPDTSTTQHRSTGSRAARSGTATRTIISTSPPPTPTGATAASSSPTPCTPTPGGPPPVAAASSSGHSSSSPPSA